MGHKSGRGSFKKTATPLWMQKYHSQQNWLYASQCREIFSFKTWVNCYVLGLSFEVYNVSLDQLAQIWQFVKVGSVLLLSKFKQCELWQTAIFEPFDPKKHYICQKKALKHGYWNLQWKMEYLWSASLQIDFSEHGALSFKRVWQPLWYCHTRFYN